VFIFPYLSRIGMRQLLLFIFFIFFSLHVFSQNTDLDILKNINRGENLNLDRSCELASDGVYPFMALSAGGVWLAGVIKKNDTLKRNGYKSAISIAAAIGLAEGLKYAVQRNRPYVDYPTEIICRKPGEDKYSFPSGHTSAAFATATALTLSTKKWYFAVPAYAYAGYVGYSRMRLGVHYPSDVLGGAILGAGCSWLTWKLDKWINKK
jgi:membrane-associated phospholipid phosphatase